MWRFSGRRHARILILDYSLTGLSWDTVHPVTDPSLPLAMHLSEHSLRQLDGAYLRSLDLEALRNRSTRLLADLKEARARLDVRAAGCSRSSQRPAPSECPRQRAELTQFIETCHQRGHDPWRTLERAITDRRAGAPSLPCRSRWANNYPTGFQSVVIEMTDL